MVAPIYWNNNSEGCFGVVQNYRTMVERFDSLSRVKENHPMISQGKLPYEYQILNEKNESGFTNLSAITPAGKSLKATNEKLKKKDYAGAFFIASQLALDFPNIIDDTLDAIDFASKYINDKTCGHNYKYLYKKAYDWKQAQHPFSYFRGTLLQDFVNPNSPKCVSKKLAMWIESCDKSLWDTRLKNFSQEKFKINVIYQKTKIKSIKSTPQKPHNIKAYKFITKSKFGEITARSMTRVPVIGLAMSGVVEGCQVINEVKNGEKAIKSIGKAIVRLTTSTAITAVLGAIGAMIAGPFGSLAGITISGFANNAIAKALG